MRKVFVILGVLLALGMMVLPAIAGESALTSLEEAQKIAKKDGKDILVDFSGSDWCGWCIKLDKEVFNTEIWKKEGTKKYVLVVLDFPRQKQLPEDQKKYNEKMKNEFGVSGFPTVYVLDSEGKPYAKTGYQKGGPDNYIKHLSEFSDRKAKRDELFAKAKEADPEDRMVILDELIGLLNKWNVGSAYIYLKEEIVALDKDNKKGLRLKYATELFNYYLSNENTNMMDMYFTIVKTIDAKKAEGLEVDIKLTEILSKYFKQKKWNEALGELEKLTTVYKEGEAAQKIYYYVGISYFRLEKLDKCIENLETSLKLAPNSGFSAQIKKDLAYLKKMHK